MVMNIHQSPIISHKYTNKYTIYNLQLYYTYIYTQLYYLYIYIRCYYRLRYLFVGICWEVTGTSDDRGPSTSIDCDQSSAARGTQHPAGKSAAMSGEAIDTFQSSKNITDVIGFMMNFKVSFRICIGSVATGVEYLLHCHHTNYAVLCFHIGLVIQCHRPLLFFFLFVVVTANAATTEPSQINERSSNNYPQSSFGVVSKFGTPTSHGFYHYFHHMFAMFEWR